MITRSKDSKRQESTGQTDHLPNLAPATSNPQSNASPPAKTRHSFSTPSTTISKSPSSTHSKFLLERRSSSFASPSSPWARRRSFLSNSMISNEKHLVYELNNYGYSSSPIYSLSLRESQGFTWNQDLFASQNQQEYALIYDDVDNDGKIDNQYSNVFEDGDEDEDMDDHSYRTTKTGRRSLSYSATNDSGINKVKVIHIKVDENDKTW